MYFSRSQIVQFGVETTSAHSGRHKSGRLGCTSTCIHTYYMYVHHENCRAKKEKALHLLKGIAVGVAPDAAQIAPENTDIGFRLFFDEKFHPTVPKPKLPDSSSVKIR